MENEELLKTKTSPSSSCVSVALKNNIWGQLISLNPNYPSTKLQEDEIIIGRQTSCHLSIKNNNISKRHCRIYREKEVIYIEDLSLNGTFLNGSVIGKGKKRPLENNCEIMILPARKEEGEPAVAFLFQEIQIPSENQENQKVGPYLKYQIGDTLGTGTFASVKIAVEKSSGNEFAIKIIDKKKYAKQSGSRKDALMDEVKILQSISHPNIIQIHDVFDTEKTLYIVLELVRGGDLFDSLQKKDRFSEKKSKLLFRQLLDAVEYLHEKGVVHRDLKPDNILFQDSTEQVVKLSDFGLSRVITQGNSLQTICGTPQYLAPEILTNVDHKGYGHKVDCWSLGGILYTMLSGYPPFDEEKGSVYEQIKEGKIDFSNSIWNEISNSGKDLILRLLTLDPLQRYDTKNAKLHPWITNEDFEQFLEKEKKLKIEEKKEEKMEEIEEKMEEIEEKMEEIEEKIENKLKRKRSNSDEEEKPICKYGKKCYRNNPLHFKEFAHPWLKETEKS